MARIKTPDAKPARLSRGVRKPKSPKASHKNGAAPTSLLEWDSLSLEAVNSILAAAEARRAVLQREAESALRAEFEAKAAALGLTLKAIMGKTPAEVEAPSRRQKAPRSKRGQGGAAQVQFKGPNGETWSGRGPTPRWLKQLEAQGKPRSEFAV
ncbi:MAG: H-NS histone family protein [Alphaproteobacteria bacterium]|nr:H-NS histone family protein [Alphaproteobacteria bacterium]